VAFAYDRRFLVGNRYRKPVVKNKQLAQPMVAALFKAIINDPALKLIDLVKAFSFKMDEYNSHRIPPVQYIMTGVVLGSFVSFSFSA